MQQLVDVGERGSGVGGGQLLLAPVAVDRPLDVAEDADRRRAGRALGEVGEREGVARVGAVGVVDDQRVLADLGDVGHGEAAVGARGPRRARPRRRSGSARRARARIWFGRPALAAHRVEGAVVEDVAVLVDLDEGRALVLGGGAQDVSATCFFSTSTVRATKVASAPSASATGLNGWSSEPNGVDLVTLPSSLVGEYWPLVSP